MPDYESKTALTPIKIAALSSLAMLAFAANSLLCRAALLGSHSDAASFTLIRLCTGALTLVWLLKMGDHNENQPKSHGSWLSSLALFTYAAGFSFAYQTIPTGTGALLLFGTVQATMITTGIINGDRLSLRQWLGLVFALGGLLLLLLPGAAVPAPQSSLLMIIAGVAWAIYSLRGRNADNPLAASTGNFLRTIPFAIFTAVIFLADINIDMTGFLLALTSGALASGIGYAIWYSVLPHLRATTAATMQLTVPVIAALLGLLFLNESMSIRVILASAAILGGVGVFIYKQK